MNPTTFIDLLLGLVLVVSLLVGLIRWRRDRKFIGIKDVMIIGVSAVAVLSGSQLIWQVRFVPEFQKCIGSLENIAALILGSLAAIFLAVQEVSKLFKPLTQSSSP